MVYTSRQFPSNYLFRGIKHNILLREVHSNEGLSLVFTCWILPTTHGAEMSQTVTSVLECRDRLPEMIIRRRVFDIMGVDKLLTHVQTFLQDPTVHGNELKSEWIAALPLIQEKPLQFLDIRLPTSINIAFARQAVNSADKVDEETASIIQSSGVALGFRVLRAHYYLMLTCLCGHIGLCG